MMRGILSCAAGLFVLAAFCLPAPPALALCTPPPKRQPSIELGPRTPIRFVAGPLAGVMARSGYVGDYCRPDRVGVAHNSARYEVAGLTLYIHWHRMEDGYVWAAPTDPQQLDRHIETLRKIAEGYSTIVLESSREPLNGVPALTRIVVFTGADRRCGVFALGRGRDLIDGDLCGAGGQPVPLRAVLQGLSVDGVIGP